MQKLSSEIDVMPKIPNTEPKSYSAEVTSLAEHQVSFKAEADAA